MHFHIEHDFPGSPEALLSAMIEPHFHLSLRLPDLGPPEFLEHTDDGEVGLLKVQYTFIGEVDPLGRRLLRGGELQWLQLIRIERGNRTGTLHFEAVRQPRVLHGDATVTTHADGGGTRRVLDGDLVVALPIVGPAVEKRIVSGLLGRLEIEAAALVSYLEE